MSRDFYPVQKSNKILRYFWKVAGADRYILEKSTYGDQIKYMCLGGIIVSTGLMAALAGGYAFYTIFEPRDYAINNVKTAASIANTYNPTDIPTAIISVIFGIIWGLVIFNIDRFIVTSTGKGDGTEEITKKELKGALPRIIMGAIIALTISKPVEIRMFKTEIDVALYQKQKEKELEFKATTTKKYEDIINKKEQDNGRYLNDLKAAKENRKDLAAKISYEISNGGCRDKCEEFKIRYAQNEIDIKNILSDPEYIKIKNEIDAIEKEKAIELSKSDAQAAAMGGLLEKIKLAHEEAGWVISLFITLLFMTIELTPIFFKLMLTKSPYDYMEENIKELIKADNGIEIRHDYYKDKEGKERELIIHHEVLKILKEKITLLESQSELSQNAISAWKNKKMKDIDENPDEFVN
jgi:hypothetical protein